MQAKTFLDRRNNCRAPASRPGLHASTRRNRVGGKIALRLSTQAAAPVLDVVSTDNKGDSSDTTPLEAAVRAISTSPQSGPAVVQQFDWYKQWYPLLVVEDADPNIPHSRQVLGMDLVIWKDNQGKWRCFKDSCPHRMGALSEGRIDEKSGDLYCNYHGWAFNGTGKCTSIPQLTLEQKESGRQLNNKRACAMSYPTREAEGLVWVWANSGPGAEEEAAAAEWRGVAGLIDEKGNNAFVSNQRWYFRTFPGSYITAKENAFNDPAHDAVLHHGVLPAFNRKFASSPAIAELQELTPTGYKVKLSRPDAKDGATATAEGTFPVANAVGGADFRGVAYIVPASPGRVAMITGLLRGSKSESPLAKILSVFFCIRWFSHVIFNRQFDSDNVMQWTVARNRANGNKAYLPAATDSGPAAAWAWLDKHGGGGPPGFTDAFDRLVNVSQEGVTRRVVLDRYEQHTKHCKSCSGAYKNVSALLPLFNVLTYALAAAAASALVVKGTTLATGLLALGTAVAAAGARVCAWLKQEFEYVDYDHNHCSKRA